MRLHYVSDGVLSIRRCDCLVLVLLLVEVVLVQESGAFSLSTQPFSSRRDRHLLATAALKESCSEEACPTCLSTRRSILSSAAVGAGSLALPRISSADSNAIGSTIDTTISLPLEYVPALGAYVVHYYLFGERFGGIVDTGSPFLTVPSTCNKFAYKYLWGCYHPERTRDSGYSNTVEGFNSNEGVVVWRKADFRFDATPTEEVSDTSSPKDLVFGVFGPALLDGPGGVFLGLIKERASWIRPSFLEQTDYQSFCIDLREHDNAQLVLSKESLFNAVSAEGNSGSDYIPLNTDLHKKYKAPVVHYTAKANSFVVNGLPLRLDERRPTYVIFDTGVTGMVVSQELFDGRYLQARKNKEKSLWGQVTVSFLTQQGNVVELSATKPITTPLGKANPFKRFQGNLLVLGLAFLDGHAMTVDISQRHIRLDWVLWPTKKLNCNYLYIFISIVNVYECSRIDATPADSECELRVQGNASISRWHCLVPNAVNIKIEILKDIVHKISHLHDIVDLDSIQIVLAIDTRLSSKAN